MLPGRQMFFNWILFSICIFFFVFSVSLPCVCVPCCFQFSCRIKGDSCRLFLLRLLWLYTCNWGSQLSSGSSVQIVRPILSLSLLGFITRAHLLLSTTFFSYNVALFVDVYSPPTFFFVFLFVLGFYVCLSGVSAVCMLLLAWKYKSNTYTWP